MDKDNLAKIPLGEAEDVEYIGQLLQANIDALSMKMNTFDPNEENHHLVVKFLNRWLAETIGSIEQNVIVNGLNYIKDDEESKRLEPLNTKLKSDVKRYEYKKEKLLLKISQMRRSVPDNVYKNMEQSLRLETDEIVHLKDGMELEFNANEGDSEILKQLKPVQITDQIKHDILEMRSMAQHLYAEYPLTKSELSDVIDCIKDYRYSMERRQRLSEYKLLNEVEKKEYLDSTINFIPNDQEDNNTNKNKAEVVAAATSTRRYIHRLKAKNKWIHLPYQKISYTVCNGKVIE